jgi:hypothetical protein
LVLGDQQELVHLPADRRLVGLALQVAADLAHDILVALLLEIGADHLERVILGRAARLAQHLRRP